MKIKNTLFAFVGMPGSGKSTLISKLGLNSNTISFDSFRELVSGLSFQSDGYITIDQKYNGSIILNLFNNALKIRFDNKADIVIDNLNLDLSNLNQLKSLADENNYDFKIVKFDLKSFNFYLNNNRKREERKKLPIDSLKHLYETFKNLDISKYKDHIISTDQFVDIIKAEKQNNLTDLSNYKSVYHIGALNGFYNTFSKFEKEHGKIKENENFYIFTGNYFQNGTDPKKVVELINRIKDFKNVILLKGDQDNNLSFYLKGLEVYDDLFYKTFINQLSENHLNLLSGIFDKLNRCFFYSFKGKKVFVSFSGVTSIPKNIALLNESAFFNGIGAFPKEKPELKRKKDSDCYQVYFGLTRFDNEENDKNIALNYNHSNHGNFCIVQLKNNKFKPFFYINRERSPFVYEKILKSFYSVDDFNIPNFDPLMYETQKVFSTIKNNNKSIAVLHSKANVYHAFFDESTSKIKIFNDRFNIIDVTIPYKICDAIIKYKCVISFFMDDKSRVHFIDSFYKFNHKIKTPMSMINTIFNKSKTIFIKSEKLNVERFVRSKLKGTNNLTVYIDNKLFCFTKS